MRLRPVLPVVAALAALTLTACDDTGSSASAGTVGDPATPASTTTGDPSPVPSTTAPPSPTPISPPPPSGSGTTTAPGSQLAYGDTALVEIYASGNNDARIEYTVTGVELTEGPIGRLARISIDVHAIDDVSGSLAMGIIDWQGIDDLGKPTVLGFAEGCDGELPVTAAGKTGTMCVAVQLTGEGTSLTEVRYKAGDYRDAPIIWKP